MRRICFAFIIMALLAPMAPAAAAELPKCRNVAGYEPKPTCQARNQRAQWQAEQTARMTASLVAEAMARQAEQDQANQGSFMDTLNGVYEDAVKTVSGLFD